MADGRHLEKWPYLCNSFSLTIWQLDAYCPSELNQPAVKISNIQKSKMADGRYIKI